MLKLEVLGLFSLFKLLLLLLHFKMTILNILNGVVFGSLRFSNRTNPCDPINSQWRNSKDGDVVAKKMSCLDDISFKLSACTVLTKLPLIRRRISILFSPNANMYGNVQAGINKFYNS